MNASIDKPDGIWKKTLRPLSRDYTVEFLFLKPPGQTQIGSRNREFEKSKVASNYA